MNRSGASLSLTSAAGRVPAVGPFMMYPVRPHAAGGRRITIGECLDAIYRRKLWVLAVVAAVSGGTWLVSVLIPRLYEATATLAIERVAPGAVSGPAAMFPAAPDMDQLIATHIRMIQSDAVLRPVSEKYGLSEDLSRGPVRLARLTVARAPGTSLIQITFRHADADKAAAVANGVAERYGLRLRDVRNGALSSLSEASQRQLSDLEQKMKDSARALMDFRARNGIAEGDSRADGLSPRLVQLNTAHARASAERAAKEAAFDSARAHTPKGDRVLQLIVTELTEARTREAKLRMEYDKAKIEADGASSQAMELRILEQRANADRSVYEELSRKVSESAIDNGLRASPVSVAEAARADWRAVRPNVPLNCAIALMISMGAACAGAVLSEVRGHRIRKLDDLAAAAGVRVVTPLPGVRAWRGLQGLAMFCEASQSPKPGDSEMPGFREEIRMLRNGLLHAPSPQRSCAVAVMSPAAGEGRSRIAAELAAAFAASGRRTLLIDANLRAPVLHALVFATGPRYGLATALSGESDWRECLLKGEAAEGVDLLPSGAPDARSFDLMHQGFPEIVTEAREAYECVVVDSPPFLGCSESLDIARSVDTVIVAGRARVTGHPEMEVMLSYLQRLDARIGAVVLNDV